MVAHVNRTGFGWDPFVGYAPYPGATFQILASHTVTPATYFPGFSAAMTGVNGIGVDPLTGRFAFVASVDDNFGTTESKFFVVENGVVSAGLLLAPDMSVGATGDISFGNGAWRVTGHYGGDAAWWIISADGTTILNTAGFGNFYMHMHVPISTTDKTIHFPFLFDNNLRFAANNNPAVLTVIGDNKITPSYPSQIALDPTGTHIFTSWDTGQRGRSSDGGSTFTGIPTLPFGGQYAYAYAGGAGVESRWIAALGVIRCSLDRGDSWLNKEGNILGLTFAPSIFIARVVEY